MSKFKTMVNKDIELCNEYLSKGFASNAEVKTLIGKYSMDYPNFNTGIINYASVPGHENNEIENIKIIKGKLEYLLNSIDNPDKFINQTSNGITIQNTNNNSNVNTNNVTANLSIEEIKEVIEDNTFLGKKEKEEMLEKLNEIIELNKINESKSKKWEIAKNILSFIIDKGADIAIMYIPHIINAIK